MNITLGFSPCPNDTFIFDALVNNQIDGEGLRFEVIMDDVQALNEMAMQGKIDITKLSYGTLPLVLDRYILLNAGGALGKGTGPLLIAPFHLPPEAVEKGTIAITGQHTTAHVLFSLAFPHATNKVFLRYDEIEGFVLQNRARPDSAIASSTEGIKLGVIIHENRFTYESKGLVKQTDLGEFWEKETGLPIPLGGIVAKRTLPSAIIAKTEGLIRKSLEHAMRRGNDLSEFIRANAREMDISVMRQHISLYVNDFTMDLGTEGKEAVRRFLQVHASIHQPLPAGGQVFFSPS